MGTSFGLRPKSSGGRGLFERHRRRDPAVRDPGADGDRGGVSVLALDGACCVGVNSRGQKAVDLLRWIIVYWYCYPSVLIIVLAVSSGPASPAAPI